MLVSKLWNLQVALHELAQELGLADHFPKRWLEPESATFPCSLANVLDLDEPTFSAYATADGRRVKREGVSMTLRHIYIYIVRSMRN